MKSNLREMLSDHISSRVYHMRCDQTYLFSWLLGDSILELTTELEQIYLERLLHLLLMFEEAEVDIAGVDDNGETLYQRIV